MEGHRLGILICYDNNIGENVRMTALAGAEILLAPHQTANPPTIKAPNGPVPIDAARTPNTRPRISTGVDVITMMLCIVAKPAIENPPIRRIGRANKNDGDNEKASIAPRNAKEPYA